MKRINYILIVIVLAFFLASVFGDAAAAQRLTPTVPPTTAAPTSTATRSTPVATPATGILYLDSNPTGASVYIDGILQGTTQLTLTTLAAGDHRVLLKKDGYADYSATITLPAGGELREVYTLIPITTPATTTPAPTVVLPAVTTPMIYIAPTSPTPTPTPLQVLPTTPLNYIAPKSPTPTPPLKPFIQMKNISTVFHPLVINAGSVSKVAVLGASSPYYSAQFMGNKSVMSFTIIEVDYYNKAKFYHDQSGGSGWYGDPALQAWADQNTVSINKNLTNFPVNFRYITAEKAVTGVLWQVSRYPFANDPKHWQNEYIPGLVASGQVKEYHNDSDGYHYFVINFAKVAGKNPGDPPYFDAPLSMLSMNTNAQGMGTVNMVSKIPFMDTGFIMKSINLGLFTLKVPVSTMAIPKGELTQAELGNPNTNMVLISADSLLLRAPSSLESFLLDMDSKYYVRVVPIHDGGKAGLPSLPVEVTVNRSDPNSFLKGDITVKPPSAKILWYMQPNLNIYQSDYVYFGGDYHWYWVNGSLKGLHTYEPPVPEDKSWWEKVSDFFGSIINYFSEVMTGMAEAWNALQDIYVDIAAKVLSYTLTGGLIRCDQIPDCSGVLKTGMQAVMAAYGIPPTLPTGPELMDLSTDYLIELGADQFGAGGVYDAYQSLPDEVKQQMKSGAQEISQQTVNAQKSAMDDATYQAYCKNYTNPSYAFDESPTITLCNYKIPDPIFNSVHPATVMVYVNNPNSESTDRLVLKVKDSMGLFYGRAVIPPLEAGKSISVPVILTEDYAQFKKVNGGPCSPDEATITYSGGSLVQPPCPVAEWVDNWHQGGKYYSNPPAEDTFTVSFTKPGPNPIYGLNDQSSGKYIPNTYLKIVYPAGWQITTQGKSIVPDTWDPNMFTSNNLGIPNTFTNLGMLRNEP